MQPGDEVFFTVYSPALGRCLDILGRVLRANPDGTVTVQSASGLVTQTIPADRVWSANPTKEK